MIKKILMSLLQIYWRKKFASKVTMTGRVYFGRHTRVQLVDGSDRRDIVIGDNVKLYGTLISQAKGKIIIEDGAHIGPFTTVGAVKCVRIGRLAMISQNVDIVDNNNHPTHPEDRLEMNMAPVDSPLKRWRFSRSAAIDVGENVWIGKRSLITKGVKIGANSIVGACSVVTRDVAENVVVAGNPASVVKVNVQADVRML